MASLGSTFCGGIGPTSATASDTSAIPGGAFGDERLPRRAYWPYLFDSDILIDISRDGPAKSRLQSSFSLAPAQTNIRQIDFGNFIYPWNKPTSWPHQLEWLDKVEQNRVRLMNGRGRLQTEDAESNVPFSGLTREEVRFDDVTGEGLAEARPAFLDSSSGANACSERTNRCGPQWACRPGVQNHLIRGTGICSNRHRRIKHSQRAERRGLWAIDSHPQREQEGYPASTACN